MSFLTTRTLNTVYRPVVLAVRANSTPRYQPQHQPGPPKLAKEDQAEFEALQKLASSRSAIDEYNASHGHEDAVEDKSPLLKTNSVGSFAPGLFKTIPEFEGEVNPVTGEIGGPKQDPLRHGDYSFNGRCTDF
ncbi:hypothetical protein BABINDRAFT_40290 [Babjeviella inositovora NRRL Y-12698]|uniref:Succinate dehydrogenase assembly factor 4, mitochondrial n=1 Tax=Babjeviella inositovora NRRL Y-12698 TaxID=984486 RepID=A0A1E3QM25_9ASCO|nr:uncharacterized protein BABINDRAFT_40290 [Babjeviella inositovora NRRL Y-12698]ODQ78037.1 hypothetical protein BABINDRAFT_40290 [Babjeviella inositovora NRRL Y-12698]